MTLKWDTAPTSVVRRRREFLGVHFTGGELADVLDWLGGRDASSSFGYVVTPNVDHLVRLARDPQLLPLYEGADACLCDGRVVRALSGLAGPPLPLVSGSDLVRALFDNVVSSGDTICLIGGTGATADGLRFLAPEVTIDHFSPPMGLATDDAARRDVLQFIRQARPRFVLLAVGSPQQEMLASELRADGEIKGTALCIGGATEYLVGSKQRAPLMVQRMGLEFVWRIAEDPARLWKRYLLDGPHIVPLFVRWWLTSRPGRPTVK
jgi:N-acetylglucosaminyldiphosphoundecaprenol N-acetyl-beta-D-mannosaminyltransferase